MQRLRMLHACLACLLVVAIPINMCVACRTNGDVATRNTHQKKLRNRNGVSFETAYTALTRSLFNFIVGHVRTGTQHNLMRQIRRAGKIDLKIDRSTSGMWKHRGLGTRKHYTMRIVVPVPTPTPPKTQLHGIIQCSGWPELQCITMWLWRI
jgi:hypothetical protein